MKHSRTFLFNTAIIASLLLVSCNRFDNPPYGIGVTNGEIYVPSEFSINEDEFKEFVAGFGWKMKDCHEIMRDGSISEYPYWIPDGIYPLIGFQRHNYYIGESELTSYYKEGIGFYLTYIFTFRDSAIFTYQDQYELCKNPLLKILEVSENEMTCIEYMGYRASRSVYALSVYKKMSDLEVQYYKDNYTTPSPVQ